MARGPIKELKFISYGSYIWAPVIAALAWFSCLLALLLLWLVRDNSRQYQPDEPSIVYISDVGANYKAIFIALNAVTFVFYSVTMLFERWLRHVDRIPGTVRSRERSCDIAAVVFAIIGGAALMFLAIFDAFNHSTVHWSLTVVFIVCIAVSAACQTAEVWYLHADHPDRPHLLRNGAMKLLIVVIAIAGAIAFGVCYGICHGSNGINGRGGQCNKILSAAAVLEWSIALLFDAYLLTLALDLWPAAKTSPRHARRVERREGKLLNEGSDNAMGYPRHSMHGTDTPPSAAGDVQSVGYPARPSAEMRQV